MQKTENRKPKTERTDDYPKILCVLPLRLCASAVRRFPAGVSALGSEGPFHTVNVSSWFRLFCLLSSVFCLLFSSSAKADAQAVHVDVVSAKAVQVVEDVPLVPGKATIVRVDMVAAAQTYATVSASLGGSRRSHDVLLNAGGNTLFVPVDPPGAAGSIPVTGQVTVGGLPA